MKKRKDDGGIVVNGFPVNEWNKSMETLDTDRIFLAALVIVAAVNIAYAFFTH